MAYFVYELVDPRCGSVFYVGKGKGNRPAAHERDARAGKPGRKCDRIREIIEAGEAPSIRIVKRFGDELLAYAEEAFHIERIGIANLTNIALGGIGCVTEPDLGAEARKWVRANKRTLYKVMAARLAGLRVWACGTDLLKLADRSIGVLRERAGEEWFDGVVGVPEWRPA